MGTIRSALPRRMHLRWRAFTSVVLLGLLVACSTAAQTAPAPSAKAAIVAAAPQAATATPVPLKLLKTSPESGPVGTTFTVNGEGLPPSKPVEFQ